VIVDLANKAFASGMANAMLISTFVMVGAALFTLRVLPTQIRCIEPECQEEVEFVGVPEPAAAVGD
jgi:hypothetical protein